MPLSEQERNIINAYQRDFPLHPRPFKQIGKNLGISEQDVLKIVGDLRERGVLSRVGAVVAPNRAGASTLAALSVPVEQLEDVAGRISEFPEVNHNYEREHTLNLWFVVAAKNREAVLDVLQRITVETGLESVELPLIKAYHIDLGFAV